MAETYDFGSVSGDAKPSELDQHMVEVQRYLSQVRAGRSLLSVDPYQPALGAHAEVLRQGAAVDKANTLAARHEKFQQGPQDTPQDGAKNAQNAPESYDFGKGSSNPEVHTFDSTEGQPVRSSKGTPFHPGQLLDFVMQPMDASLRADVEKVTGTSGLEFLKPGTWTPSNVGKSLVGTAADMLTSPLTYLGSPLVGTVPKAGIGAAGAAGAARGASSIPPVIRALTHDQLDVHVAERALSKSAFETQAFPDAGLTPRTVVSTGNDLTLPSLDIPFLEGTTTRPGPVTRGAKGRFGRSYYPDLQPGEMRTEPGQLSLTGPGYPSETAPQGKYILRPGEQTPQGMDILRPQVRTNEGMSAKGNQEYTDYIVRGEYPSTYNMNQYPKLNLKDRILTPQMERDLVTNSLEMGGAPIEITYSKGGSASAGPRVNEAFTLPSDLNVTNTADGTIFPSRYARGAGSVLDAMRSSGPIGNTIADLGDMAYSNRAIGTSQDMIHATKAFDEIFGQTTLAQRIGIGVRQLMAGENPFIFGGKKYWGYNEKLEEQIFNDMYTSGRMRATDPKAAHAADKLFEHGTYPASSDPGVRTLTITNPFTGKEMPLGQPSKFMPQQPVHPITSKAISDAQWGILYERAGGEKLGISLDQYKKTIVKLSQHDPEVTGAKMKGLENMRLLDLESLGGSPYQWAKKLGYETDPFRAAFRFNSLARLRGQLKQIEEPVNKLLLQVPANADDAGKWLHLATDRMMMNPGKYDALTTTKNTLKGLSHLLDISMLQLGGLANMAQASFIAARGGGRATIKGMFDMVTKHDRLLIERSGALFPSALNEMTNPTGPLSVFSSGAYRLYGMAMIDRNTRVFAGHVGNRFIQQLESNLLANPSSKTLQGLISELGGDPKVLLQQGAIPDPMRLAMIQRFANHTAGVTDARGTPLWASSENPWARLVNKYRTFAAANSAEVRRLVLNAPTPLVAAERVATLLASAYVIGGGINEMRKGLRDSLMGEEARPSKHGIAAHAERLVQGLGTIEGMFLVNAANDPTTAVLSAVGGPGAGVGASIIQDLQSTAKHGLGWRTIDTVSKRVPIVGPITGPLVGKHVRKETKRTAEQSRELQD